MIEYNSNQNFDTELYSVQTIVRLHKIKGKLLFDWEWTKLERTQGRVLRKAKGKEFAYIHDFIILPPPKKSIRGAEMLEFELKRVKEMAENAENIEEVNAFIKNIENNFKYSLKD